MARKPKIVPRKKPKIISAAKPVTDTVVDTVTDTVNTATEPVVEQGAEVVEQPVTETPTPAPTPTPTAPNAPPVVMTREREAAQVFAYATNLHTQGDFAGAERAYARAINLAPDNPDIYNNMGICLRAQGKLAAAITCYRRSLVLRAESAEVFSNLGNAQRDLAQYHSAITSFAQALKLNPKSNRALFNMGMALRDVGEVEQAIRCLKNIVTENHHDIVAHLELGYCLLMRGDLELGFTALEMRVGLPGVVEQMPTNNGTILQWDGQPLGGKTVLIFQDGGLGDLIQFGRYISHVKERGANVLVECHKKSATLMASVPGVDKICIAGNQRPHYDVYAPITSLPHILAIGNHTLVEQVPYVSTDDAQSVKLPPAGGLQLRTGLCWSPDVVRKNAEAVGNNRACPLDELMSLLAIPGITAFSLQGGERAGDVQTISSPALMTDLSPQINDLSDLADAISQLDLVICVDSVTAHVAGALGKPTWVLLPFVSDWRWHPVGETSIWYPEMRLFRQSEAGDWSDAIEELRTALYSRTTNRLN